MLCPLLAGAGATPPPFYVPNPPLLPLQHEGYIKGVMPYYPEAAGWYDPNAEWLVKAYWCGIEPATGFQQVVFGGARPPEHPSWEQDPVVALMEDMDVFEPRRLDVWGEWGVMIDLGLLKEGGPMDLLKFRTAEKWLGAPGGEPSVPGSDVLPEVVLMTDGRDDFPAVMGEGVVWQTETGNGWDIVFANLENGNSQILAQEAEDETRPAIWQNAVDEYLVAYQIEEKLVLLTVDRNGAVDESKTMSISDPDGVMAFSQPTVSSKGVAYQVQDPSGTAVPNKIGVWDFAKEDNYLIESADIGSRCRELIQPRLGGTEGKFLVFLGADCDVTYDGDKNVLFVINIASGDVFRYPFPGNPVYSRFQLVYGARYDIVGSVIVLVDGGEEIHYLAMDL